MIQETELQTQKFYALFKELTIFLKNYGARSLLFQLQLIGDSFETEKIDPNDQLQLLNHLSSRFKENNIDYLYQMFQLRTKLNTYKPNDILFNKTFEIVTSTFETTKEAILDKNNRDGTRLYAIGTVFKLLVETIGYTPDEITELTDKSRCIISRHKNMITYLDDSHPLDRKMITKYIKSKKQLIKYLLYEYQEER